MQIAPASPHNTEAIMAGNRPVTTLFNAGSAAEAGEKIDLGGRRHRGPQ